MEQRPRRPVTGSLDGFITPGSRPAHHRPAPPKPQFSKPARVEAPKPKVEPSSARPNFKASKEAANFNPYYSSYSSKSGEKKRPKLRHKWSRRKKVVMSALGVLLIVFGTGAYFGTTILSNLDKAFHGNVFSDVHALLSNTQLKGEAQGRVNILVGGESENVPGHQGAQLTDSIMILSIDTKNDTAFMLSIPRDLWVYIPGLGAYQKINAANDVSMSELQQVVQTDLGIPIDYRVAIDYNAFKDAVNAVGGIRIDIQSSDPRGLYDAYTHLKLPNGWVTLNGATALNLARARGDESAGDVSYGFPDTDFTRTQHQRQMAVAIAKKAMTAGVLTNPIKITNLVKAVGDNVETNMNLQDVLAFAKLLRKVNLNKIGSYTYSSTTTGANASTALLTDYTDPASGEESLAPTAGVGQYGQLQEYYQQLISNNPVVKEDASVVLLNGTNADGVAQKSEDIVKANKIDNDTIGDAYDEYPKTMIIDMSNGQDPATKALLQRLFPGSTTVTSDTGSYEAEEAQNYNADFVVVLGQNSVNVKQP